MILTLDIGNTRIKAAIFSGKDMIASWSEGEQGEYYTRYYDQIESAIICTTGEEKNLSKWIPKGVKTLTVSSALSLPIQIDYATPETLGSDRIAATCGVRQLFEGQNCLIIDAGTCITIDYLDKEGTFHGGAILPGITMRFCALHQYTNRLPLIDAKDVDWSQTAICGKNTRESIISGVGAALYYEIIGYIGYYQQFGCQYVICTGGDGAIIRQLLLVANKGYQENSLVVEYEPHLVMIGLNHIARTNNFFSEER